MLWLPFCRAGPALMKQVLASILTTLMIVAMTLSAMVILERATIYVTSIASPLPRAGAIAAEILLGVILLLGTVWLATHLAVLIFAPKHNPSEGGTLG
ncbi:MAG TPA: hypothetical protein VFB10_03465 [Candidatus Dormibacteraeota bacterium]|nr:hypothetical protein [Candidatus Dormibacteraeota bacterium]